MSSPIVIHVLRPYATEEEYLEAERFSIDSKTMLLIDQPALPANTPVVFDVSLSNGHKPIRAEGKVLGYVGAEGGNPGGLRVRFKRFGSATKAFIDRAIGAAAAAEAADRPSLPEVIDAAALTASVSLQSPAPEPSAPEPSAPESPRVEAMPEPLPAEAAETSGVHRKIVAPVAAPFNREALLARLRERHAG